MKARNVQRVKCDFHLNNNERKTERQKDRKEERQKDSEHQKQTNK